MERNMTGEQFPPKIEPTLIQEETNASWKIWIAAGGCLVLICAAAFIGVLIFVGPKFVNQVIPTANVKTPEELPRKTIQNNTMGNPNAPVHVIEYSDFQCPYCRKFWSETEPQLIKEYVNTGKVYFEYHSEGAFLGEESGWAAEGAYCAGDQNKFWEYHDTLFTNQTGENVGDFSKVKLISYAKALGLNMDDFESCINGEKQKLTVASDEAKAKANGVRAVPTFFINGVKIEGAQPFSVFKDEIEKSLKGKPTS
jgi:protein-disulfide isomerase